MPLPWRRSAGVVLVVAGVALLAFPLTSLTGAWAASVVVLGARGIMLARQRRLWQGALLLLVAVALVAVASRLSGAAHLVAAAWALACAVCALFPHAPGSRMRRMTAVVAGGSGVLLALRWPDVATLGLAWAVALAVVAGSGLAVLRAPRAPRAVAELDDGRMRWFGSWRTTVASVLVLSLVGSAWWLNAQLAPVAPVPTAFYERPGEVPAEPGQLLRAERYDGDLPSGVAGSRILYTTTRGDGSPTVASALVALPVGEGPRTMVAWQHGTLGTDVRCAPSLTDDALADTNVPGARAALARGWGLVALDYPGLGVAGPATYLVGADEGRATLDAVRAAQQVDAGRAPGPLMLWGHSQGGHATLWAGQLADSYAPELDLRGVAALSAAHDPAAMAAHTTRSGPTGFAALAVAFVLDSYTEAYEELTRAELVDPAGIAFLDAASSRCTADPGTLVTVLATAATRLDRTLFTVDDADVKRRLVENAASGDVGVPLLLAQGDTDTVVPVSMQRTLAARVCAGTAPVTVREYAGLGHLDVVQPGSPLVGDLLAWSDEVLASGEPRDCG
ncbi:lipase family protein [Sanguibacter sp. A247]|uniref:lipase family protein n=1 Tax=unclassified Sanguibacter TaxID=2645534 RepID=UPI003FD83F03